MRSGNSPTASGVLIGLATLPHLRPQSSRPCKDAAGGQLVAIRLCEYRFRRRGTGR
jgi:hypothetical protein